MNAQKATEKGKWSAKWTCRKWATDEAYLAGEAPFEEIEVGHFIGIADPFDPNKRPGNTLLNEGIQLLLDLLIGAGGTVYSNANAYLGVGNASISALTGTVTFTNASTAVTGSGTSFDTELEAGDIIRLDADDLFVEVASVESATALTLVSNYPSTGGAGAASKVDKGAATDTGLIGSSKEFQPMEATYPQRSGQTVTWRSVFTSTEALFRWLEVTVVNASSDTGTNLNRKAVDLGQHSTGTWTLDLQVTIS